MSSSDQLFHLVAADVWQAAKDSRTPYYPATYEQDGFIHLTADPAFLLGVANHFYRSSTNQDWLLLVLDPARLTSRVVFEPAAAVGDTKPGPELQRGDDGDEAASPGAPLFPHLYGTIDFDAVLQEVTIVRAEDGTFEHIPGFTPTPSSG